MTNTFCPCKFALFECTCLWGSPMKLERQITQKTDLLNTATDLSPVQRSLIQEVNNSPIFADRRQTGSRVTNQKIHVGFWIPYFNLDEMDRLLFTLRNRLISDQPLDDFADRLLQSALEMTYRPNQPIFGMIAGAIIFNYFCLQLALQPPGNMVINQCEI